MQIILTLVVQAFTLSVICTVHNELCKFVDVLDLAVQSTMNSVSVLMC